MRYANGVSVPVCRAGRAELKVPGKDWKKGNLLNAALLVNDEVFLDLYDLWIAPAVALMSESHPEPDDSSLFFMGAEEEEGKTFRERFRKFVLGRPPYGRGADGIWPQCPVDQILSQVDSIRQEVPSYICLRVEILCMLLGVVPNQAFAEGSGWSGYFFSLGGEPDQREVSADMVFPLVFTTGKELYPAVLVNSSDSPCRIRVVYQEIDYPIFLPPHGFLRAVFGDAERSRLVSLKGNISYNSEETRNAVVQMANGDDQALFLFHMSYHDPFELETGGPFSDAAADGRGGAVILSRRGLYCTQNDQLLENRNPIRVYGAGDLWAWQYADGHLESNMHFRGGRPVTKAIAVVEDGDQALLFLDEVGAWICQGGSTSEITREEFVRCMLGRFSEEGLCESTESSLMKLVITREGALEAR